MASQQRNPLLDEFVFPPYDAILPGHVRSAFQSLLCKLEDELVILEASVEPTWPKLVEPFERIKDRLSVVWGIVNHLNCVKDSPELRSAVEQIQPEKVKFQLRLGQSKPLYDAFRAIQESADYESLNDARKRIVEAQIKEAVLNGVSLEGDQRKRFNDIQQELENLGQTFEGNLLDATNKFEKVVTDKCDAEGITATGLSMAAQTAVSKGYENATAENGPWIFTLDGPSYRSVVQHSRNRALREELYRARIVRASSGALDNTPIIEKILKLRLEKAQLLGFNNYAEVSLENKMATGREAEELIEELCQACRNPVIQDIKELEDLARAQNAPEANQLRHWDIDFWGERLREFKCAINEEDLRAYFPLSDVLDGLFSLVKKLFSINIEPFDGLASVWHNDVKFFSVKDLSGSPLAYFYLDPYSRPSEKRGGAWVDLVVGRSSAFSLGSESSRLPIVNVVCNQTPPVDGRPSLMTFREVETLFHEFGHALQHMLTKQDEGLVSGTHGIEFDAVELPSQLMEHWCYQRETLMRIGRHYKSRKNLPDEVCSKLISARSFRAGSELLRQLRFASVDLELHTKYVPGGSESVFDIDQIVGKRTQVLPLLPEDRFLCSFSHIFADTYAAGYYSYQWAEVLAADAFSAFDEVGLDNDKAIREVGLRFRETVLALGGGKSPLQVFIDFRGRGPSPEPLLRYYGLEPLPALA